MEARTWNYVIEIMVYIEIERRDCRPRRRHVFNAKSTQSRTENDVEMQTDRKSTGYYSVDAS
jgi:hypothetical protein